MSDFSVVLFVLHFHVCTHYQVMLKFLGQMVDALFYIHNQNIFHRNIKPSNILVTGEASFKLCDFGTETLMTDEWKWKIRVEESSKCWMAPEAFRFSFSDKSDIWSLGCVLLDMMTSFVLNEFSVPYRISFVSRNPRDLIDVPFIGECLIAAGSSLIKQKNTLSSCIIDVFLKGGFRSILELMQAFWDVEEVQARVMQRLASFVGDNSEVAAENLRKAGLISGLLSILQNFIHNEQICHSSCAALWSLAVSENNADQVLLQSAVPIITAVIREHLQNGAVLKSACSALWALSLQGFLDKNDYEPTTALLMDALRMNMEGPMLVNNTCLALASLLRLSEISAFRFITDSKGSGINLIKDAYHFYCDDPQVVESICVLINEMAQYDDVVLDMVSQQMEELLSEIKSRFPSSMEIMTLVDTALLKLQK
ncbi:UNVERIFIED_CONTAM: hypothetical protein H355_006721 [Colinus virginianus]|nr:hypothetical protein H355_006721 [Colinus virginianus]